MDFPIRILQRPSNLQGDKPTEKPTPTAPIRSREQREADYAAARLRILGSEKPEDDKAEPAPGGALAKSATARTSAVQETANVNLTVDLPTDDCSGQTLSGAPLHSSPGSVSKVPQATHIDGLDDVSSLHCCQSTYLIDTDDQSNANFDVANSPHSAQPIKQQPTPPPLMSIKTSPVGLDHLSSFTPRGTPLLGTPSLSVLSLPKSTTRAAGLARPTHAVVSVAQTLQQQQQQQQIVYLSQHTTKPSPPQSGRHSDSNLFTKQFTQRSPTSMRQLNLSMQQQYALLHRYGPLLSSTTVWNPYQQSQTQSNHLATYTAPSQPAIQSIHACENGLEGPLFFYTTDTVSIANGAGLAPQLVQPNGHSGNSLTQRRYTNPSSFQ